MRVNDLIEIHKSKVYAYNWISEMLTDQHWIGAGIRVGLNCGAKIGCGLAGGNWTKVEAILQEVFDDRTIIVFVY